MKALVIGYGSIGKRHVKNLLKFPKLDVIVCTKNKEIQSLRKNCMVFDNLNKSLAEKPDFGIIANETSYHIKTATELANANVNFFIEKPISNSMYQIEKLEKLVSSKHLITFVGYNLRFHKSIKKIKDLLQKGKMGRVISVQSESGSFLPEWHPYENYKKGYAARNNLGGGVVLTCSHELDYLLWFFGKVDKVFSVGGKFSDLDINVEDHSSIILNFKNKIVGELHLDFYQTPTSQFCKIITTKGTIYWNAKDNLVQVYDRDRERWMTELKLKNYQRNTMYLDEMKHFINCIKKNKETVIPLKEGIETLKVALAVKKSLNNKKMVSI